MATTDIARVLTHCLRQSRPVYIELPRAMVVVDCLPVQALQDPALDIDNLVANGRMPIASDVGDCLFTAMDVDHTTLLGPGDYATMGFGVPVGNWAIAGDLAGTPSCWCLTTPAGRCSIPFSRSPSLPTWTNGALSPWPRAWGGRWCSGA